MFFVALVFILFVCALIWFGNVQAKKRTRELGALAPTLQLAFEPGPFTPGTGPFAGASSFAIFHNGYDRKITNLLHGQVDDAAAQIFDYRYSIRDRDTGSSSSSSHGSSTYSFTAVLFSKSAPPFFPNMQLYPESIFSKLGSVLGGQDIDFAEYPEFSKHFVLKSNSEPAVRAMFDQSAAAFFEANQGVTVQTEGPHLIFYRANKRAKPAEIRPLLDTGVYAYRVLSAAAARSGR